MKKQHFKATALPRQKTSFADRVGSILYNWHSGKSRQVPLSFLGSGEHLCLYVTPDHLTALCGLITASIWGTISSMTSQKLSLQINIWISAQPCQPVRETSLKYVFLKSIGMLFPFSFFSFWEREGEGPLIPFLFLCTNLIPVPDSVMCAMIMLEDSLKKESGRW